MDFSLKFDTDKISTLKSGIIAADELHSYEFSAKSGQVISIALSSNENNSCFDLLYEEENGDWVYVDNNEGISSEKRAWSGVLPNSHKGKYLIEVSNYFSRIDAEYNLFVGISAVTVNDGSVERQVSKNAADGIYIGMSLPDLMEYTKEKSLVIGSDDEGVISLEIQVANKFLMALYMDTNYIAHDSKVKIIEAWGREFITEEKVFPTMPLDEAIEIYGGLENIEYSETEAREFATFTNHPEGIIVEVYGGDFPDNENNTKEIVSDAQVIALWVKG